MKKFLCLLSLLLIFILSCSDQPFVVGVDSPLRVVYISPTDSATNVSRDVIIRVVFSEEVVESTLAENVVLYDYSKKDESLKVETELTYTKESNTVTLKPRKSLNFGTQYMIRVKSGVTKVDTKDSKGGRLAREISALFTTEYIDDLKVLSVYPSNGANGVEPDANIVITFSEAVDNTPPSFDQTTTFVVCDMGSKDAFTDGKCNSPIAGSWTFDEKRVIATFKPEKDFGYARFVRLILSTQIRSQRAKDFGDKVENTYYGHLRADYTVDFSTRLLDRFNVVSISPANGAGSVTLNSKIVIKFSEAVNTNSVIFFNKGGDESSLKDTATLLVEDITDINNIIPLYMKGEWDSENKILTLVNVNPSDGESIVDLKYSRIIRVTLKSKIQSVRGSNLINPPEALKNSQGYLNNGESDYISIFSTIDPPELLIVNVAPDIESRDVSIRTDIRITFSEAVNMDTMKYPADISSNDYTFRVTDITDENNILLIEPIDAQSPFKVDSDAPNTVIFTPKYPLDYLHKYRVELKEGIASLEATQNSGYLRLPLSYYFTTEGVEPFFVTSLSPEDKSVNNGIYSMLRVRFNRAFGTDTLLYEVQSGSITSVNDKVITDDSAHMIPDAFRGYILHFEKGSSTCSAFVLGNTEKSFEISENPACAPDNTFSYTLLKPALSLSGGANLIEPLSTDEPFYYYRRYLSSGMVVSSGTDSITDTSKSFADDELKGRLIRFLRGKASGEEYEIISNTKDTIKVGTPFTTQPDTGSEYIIVESADILKSTVSSADRRSIKIGGADFNIDELKGFEIFVSDGAGKGQIRGIIANDKDMLFVDSDFETTPDNTSQIVIREAREFIYVPKRTFAYGATINGRINDIVTAAIIDSKDGRLDELNFSFGIVLAPELAIKSVSPSDMSDNIDTEVTIKVFFSEAVDPATIKKESNNIVLLDGSLTPVDFTILPVGSETDNIEIIPVKTALNQPRLKYSEKYTLVLKSQITSLRGGSLGNDYSFTFKTIDPPPLSLLYSYPSAADGVITTGIKRETTPNSGVPTSFVFAFSEGVRQININSSSLKVEDVSTLSNPFDINQSGTPIQYDLTFNEDDTPLDGSRGVGADNIMTITPSDLLNYSTVVRIIIKGEDDPIGVNCADSSSCKTTGIFTGDRVTNEGGQLRNTLMIVFRIEDPEPLRIIQTYSENGNLYLKRDNGGKTESVFVKFTEGVKQSSFTLNNTVFFEDVTGVADPINGNAISNIAADISFYNNQGTIQSDLPTTTDMIGRDTIAKITPQGLLGYATILRLRIKGANPPSFSGVYSDRATGINGQLPICTPDSGYNCNSNGEYVYLFKVEGINDLYVRSITPGDGSTGIPYDSKEIVIVFSEPVDCTTINSTNIRIETIFPSTSPISGTFVCNQEIVTFTANQNFGYSKDMRVTISNAVRSFNAQYVNSNADPLIGHLRSSVAATFSTIDPPAPYIVSMNPGPISTNVQREAEVQITFNEALDPASVNTTNFSMTDTTTMNILSCSTLELINSGTTIRCVPQSLFDYSHNISVTLTGGPSGIRSLIATTRGGWFNPVPNPYSYTFRIIDIPELTVLATNFSGSETFAPNANLQIIFNSYVNFSDIVGNSSDISDDRIFLVKASDVNTRIPVLLENPIAGGESSPSTIRITPLSALEYSTSYSVIVMGGYPDGVCRPERNLFNNGGCITDMSIGGTDYKGLRFDFAVSSAPGLAIESVIPADNSTGVDRRPEIRIVFNNDIQFATVDGNICLTKGANISTDCSGPLAIPLQPFAQIDPKTVSTYPLSDLDYDTTYTIVITKGVVDIYGDTLDSYYTSIFTTITSTLVQDIVVWDGTQYNNSTFFDLDDMHIRVRFTEDMDVSTINNGTVYLTYQDEFQNIVRLDGNISWDVVPNDKKVMYFKPDMFNLFSCDGQEIYAWGNDGKSSISPSNLFSSPSYSFDSSYIGKILFISGSLNGYNGYYDISGVSGGSLILEGADFKVAENSLKFTIMNSKPVIPYNTTFRFHITANVFNADHSKNVAPSAGNYELLKDFKSVSEPKIKEVVYSNSIIRKGGEYFYVTDTNLFDAKDVPVVSKLKIKFNEEIDPTTVNYRDIILSDLWASDGSITAGSDLFKITSSSFSSTDVGKYIWVFLRDRISGPHQIVAFVDANTVKVDTTFATSLSNLYFIKGLNANLPDVITLADSNKTIVFDTNKLASHLDYSKNYRLVMMGKSRLNYNYYVKTKSGNFIKGILNVDFTTSDETTVVFNPVDWSSTNNEINDPMLFVAIFSRDVDIASVDENSFYVVQNGEKLPALFAYYTDFPKIVTMIPIPAFKTGTNADFYVNQRVRDYRGNPLSREWRSTLTVSSAPGGAALTLENPTVTPTSGSIIKANQTITLKWAFAGGNFRDLILPTSFNNYSIKLKNNTDGSFVLVDTRLIPGGNNGDTVEIKPRENLRGGASYTLTIDMSKCANLYRLPGSGILTYNYTVENTAPQILAAGPTGPSNPALSKIWIAFNEEIDMKTVNYNTITLTDLASGSQVYGVYEQIYESITGRWIIYFIPSTPLRNNLSGYQVTVKSGNTGVKDLGGTSLLLDYNYSFSIDNISPQVISVNPPDGSSGVAVDSEIVVTFNEAIMPSSVYGSTESSTGTFNVTYTSACRSIKHTYGCIKLSTDFTSVRFIPALPDRLIGDRNYSVDIDETRVSDLAGNVMNVVDLRPVSTFTTKSDVPVLSCVIPPPASNQPFVLFFNEEVDYSAPNSVIVYRVSDGNSVAINLSGVMGAVGYEVSVSEQSGDWASGDYGYIVTKSIKDIDGNSLPIEYNGYFTIP
ncbi:MAG: Ig-like domain-containing protein [Myxococcota bacterium]